MKTGSGLRLFRGFAVSYVVTEAGPGTTRLVAKLVVGDGNGLLGRARSTLLGWGDLFMMRRQLHTLRTPAERQHAKKRV